MPDSPGISTLDPPTAHADDLSRLRIFAYTTEPNAPLYRAVMRVFADGKAHYQIHFRPEQVAAELERQAIVAALPEGALERALDQLTHWGNLRRTHDTSRVATLDDFRRRHFLYQITPAGEAAERAVGAVIDALLESGSLQTVMLGAILRNLRDLAVQMRARRRNEEVEPRRLYEALFNVTEQFRALTENASIFLARLHEAVDTGEARTPELLAYKEAVIAYLDDFVRELNETAPHIVRALEEIESENGAETLLTLAAEADPAPTLDGRRDVVGRLRRQWRGVSAWFLGTTGRPATLTLLRRAAVQAIDRILRVIERIHERRFQRTNRTADLLRLAAWLGDEDLVPDPHALFQDAFGLFSARHLGAVDDEVSAIQPSRDWHETPPVELSPSLRRSGRRTVTGRAPRISDHGAARRRLREAHRLLREREARALERFTELGPRHLSDLPRLDDDQLDLLLAFLDRLLAAPPDAEGRRRARSRDGRLDLALDAAGDRDPAVVRARRGRLTLPDFRLTVLGSRARGAIGRQGAGAR